MSTLSRNRHLSLPCLTASAALTLASPTLADRALPDQPSTRAAYSTNMPSASHTAGGFSVGLGLAHLWDLEDVDEIADLEQDSRGFTRVDDLEESSTELLLDFHYGWRALCPFTDCAFGPYVAVNFDESGIRTHAYGWSVQFPRWSLGLGRATRADVRYIPDDAMIGADGAPEVREADFSSLMALVSVRF